MAKILASAEFEDEVLNSNLPVLVDFFATWCGPCKIVAPALDEISGEMEGKAKVLKIDVDQSGQIADKYNVRSVPTLMFFKNGEVKDKIIGAAQKEAIVSKLEGLL
jgi:thioredoxin 1